MLLAIVYQFDMETNDKINFQYNPQDLVELSIG